MLFALNFEQVSLRVCLKGNEVSSYTPKAIEMESSPFSYTRKILDFRLAIAIK